MLDVARFDEFFRALHPEFEDGAFPWQKKLVAQIAESGRWPELLDLPTGTGKTTAIDIAVYLLALRADQPRRIVFVVDRRVIVHQAAVRARDIAEKLTCARTGILHEAAEALRDRASTDLPATAPPVSSHELRGGIVRDDHWVGRPDVPSIIVSTVDQVGSRLLFRGYGVSHGMRPVHAGLLANDTLFLLDEVHLARAFAETLGAIDHHYRPQAQSALPNRWQIAHLSATPAKDGLTEEPFTLTKWDRDPECRLAQRLAARKPARIDLVKVKGDDESKHRAALAGVCVANVGQLIDQGARTVGVVVNRVDTANQIYRRLNPDGVQAVLLTGRMRPLDRDVVLRDVIKRVRTNRGPAADDKPFVLVSTQAIEAGADFDFDAVVTECASLDALIQRFGRVDRAGGCTAENRTFRSVILATSAAVKNDADDPVYGQRLAKTWEWLEQQPRLDFGIDHFLIDAEVRAKLMAEAPAAPILLPSHLDRWVQTSHPPDADPDPAHWLHGIRDSDTDVSVIWRADVTREALDSTREGTSFARLLPLLEACRPSSGEAMPLPLSVARGWLANKVDHREDVPTLSDVESAPSAESDRQARAIAPVIAWMGDESKLLTRSDDIAPGMTLVVPATYGGINACCWAADSRTHVRDLGTVANFVQRDRIVLRLNRGVFDGQFEPPQPPPVTEDDEEAKQDAVTWVADNRDQILKFVEDVVDEGRLERFREALSARLKATIVVNGPAADDNADQRLFIVRPAKKKRGGRRAADSEPGTSSFLSAPVGLDEHLSDVSRWARALGLACDLPGHIAEDLALAGELHDLGKADPRFQRMLAAREIGREHELLAKSVIDADDYGTRVRRARLVGYDQGTRHELTSVALIRHDSALAAQAHDWDLVLHLVASHHGYGRPFFEPNAASGTETVAVTYHGRTLRCSSDHGLAGIGSGVPQRFWRCVRRYGWFGLAWLEAIVRLADHRASEYATERQG